MHSHSATLSVTVECEPLERSHAAEFLSMPALTARRRAQRRRFTTSAIGSSNREHVSDASSAWWHWPLHPLRSEPMIPTASAALDSLTFPRYFSDDEYDGHHHPPMLQEEPGIVETDIDNRPVPQTLFRRRRFASGAHDLALTTRSPTTDELKKTYASLPSSPMISDSVPFSHTRSPPSDNVKVKEEAVVETPLHDCDVPPFSLWDYLREELLATDFDSHQELKWERVSNFLGVPLALERVSHTFRN